VIDHTSRRNVICVYNRAEGTLSEMQIDRVVEFTSY
jgi:hypothetical protein